MRGVPFRGGEPETWQERVWVRRWGIGWPHLHSWYDVGDKGANHYQICRYGPCGARRVLCSRRLHGPIDLAWLRGAEWDRPAPKAPQGMRSGVGFPGVPTAKRISTDIEVSQTCEVSAPHVTVRIGSLDGDSLGRLAYNRWRLTSFGRHSGFDLPWDRLAAEERAEWVEVAQTVASAALGL